MRLGLLLLLGCSPGSEGGSNAPKAGVDEPGDTGTPDSAPPTDTGDSAHTGPVDSGDSAPPDSGDTAEPEPESCLDRLFAANGFSTVPDYLGTGATFNADCTGTNHQEIAEIERVVFLGDSVTVGSPPNTVEEFYRSELTNWLVARYGLIAPEYLWFWYDVFAGTGYMMNSGDFAVCAKWGARTDTDKERFPGKFYVVFANVYEFTDGFGDVDACPGADLAGYHYDLGSPIIQDLLASIQQEYLQIAADTQTDMIFLGEAFCGHGYNRDDTTGRCYRDPTAELWFDESCFHPNNTGHGEIATLFSRTIEQ